MRLYTIGFTKKSAKKFFAKLAEAGVRRVVDIRLNNVSQLAGFAKKDDLAFFLKEICNIEYIHKPELAPTKEILDAYKKNKGDWNSYVDQFTRLLEARKPEKRLLSEIKDGDCFLCSEDRPEKCHRRLVAEHFQDKWGNIEIIHLI